MSKAQMATTMTVSAEREILWSDDFNPIKTMKIDEDDKGIVSLSQMANANTNQREYFVWPLDSLQFPNFTTTSRSYFTLTVEGSNYVFGRLIIGYTITDFDYDAKDDMIYFCGVENNLNGYHKNIIGRVRFFDLFYSTSYTVPIDIFYITVNNPKAYLQKIDFFRSNVNNAPRLSLIANDEDSQNNTVGTNNYMLGFFSSYYIWYDIASNTYQSFETYNTRLTDVIHTKDYIIVCGMRDLQTLVLYSHIKDAPSIYTSKYYNTYPLYHNFKYPQYEIIGLGSKENTFLIGCSVIAPQEDRMEFSFFNIDTIINKLHTQIVTGMEEECRSRITDMVFDSVTRFVHVLACNGCSMLNVKDMIFQVQPYLVNPYISFMTVPNEAKSGCYLMKSLTLYNKNQDFLVFGARANDSIVNVDGTFSGFKGNLYFFDRLAYDNGYATNCGEDYKLLIGPNNSYYVEVEGHMYNNITINNATTNLISAGNLDKLCNLICN